MSTQVEGEIEGPKSSIVEYQETEAKLAILRKQYKGVLFDVTTTSGDKAARVVRKQFVTLRTSLNEKRLELNAEDRARIESRNADAARITAEIGKLEDPIDEQIKAQETRKEAERVAKIDAEIARVAEIDGRIEAIRRLHLRAMGKTSAHARAVLAEAEAASVTQEVFQEKTVLATEALDMALIAIRGIVVERELHESEQQRLKEEREELARLREAENVRVAAESARRAEEERQAKAVRDEEARRHAEQLRQQREEQERNAAAERQRIADEDARIAAERAEVARQQDALREAQKPPKAPAPVTRAGTAIKPPTASEIVAVLSSHYRARPDTIVDWLVSMDFADAAEAA